MAGTHLLDDDQPVDPHGRGPMLALMGLLSGTLPPAAALSHDELSIEGSRDALEELPALFDVPLAPAASNADASRPNADPDRNSTSNEPN